jgi:hypothetical protein
MINFLNKILNFFINLKKAKETIIKLNEIKLLNGKILAEIQKKNFYLDLNNSEFKVFSQFGEDGIIQYLVNNLKITNKIFIEFGVENYEEANTRFLLENNNWSGLIIDSSSENISHIKKQNYYWRNKLIAIREFVSPENINEIIKKNQFNGNIGLLSVDIDGNDYWVLNAIEVVFPDIIIMEYNANFGSDKSLTIKYNPSFKRAKTGINKLIYGCSLKAASNLCETKGYSLVYVNKNGNNAFFVKKKLLNAKIKATTVESSFKANSFKEFFDVNGFPCPVSKNQIIEIQNSDLVENI